MKVVIILILLSLVGCGSLKKWALRSAGPVFESSSQKLTQEKNWEFFKNASPANLKFLEMIYLQDPDNELILPVLAKGHTGYAYGVPETLYLEDRILGIDESQNRREALSHYTQALDYGLEYLTIKGIKRRDLLEMDEKKLLEKLDKKLDETDHLATLYTAQSWGSLINLQMENIVLVGQVPRVKILFDWVCKKNPKIEHQVCPIFMAQYEASRPKMLGGDPKKAEELYLEAIKNNPSHLLIRLNYIQYLLLPGFEEEKYEEQAVVLRKEFAKWSDLNRDNLEDQSEYRFHKEINLYNAIAKKRFDIIEKHKKKIF